MDRRFALSSPAGKSLVPLSREDARLDPFLGCTIRKIFGSQWYYGQVIAIDVDVASGDRAYHIAYEDGDEEHLSSSEVRNLVVMASRSAPPSEPGSPRRSLVPSHRPSVGPSVVAVGPSVARAEAPRPSIAPSISQPPVVAASFGLGDSLKPSFSFWGSMLLAGFTGALMVALVSSFLSFMMSSGDLVDGVGTRMPMPVGLVAPLPPWAEVESQQRVPKLNPGGSNGPLEELAPVLVEELQEKPEAEVANDPPTQPEETLETSEDEQALPVKALEAEELLEPVETPSKAEDDKDDDQFLRDEPPGTQLMDDSALEEDLSVAVAAVMDASGLVVRVVAKSFFRSLEEVWHWILSAFSSSLTGASWTGGAETIDPPAPPVPEPEEAAGALQSLMTTILVACAGVITILVNIHPPSVSQELQDVVHIHEAKTVLLPYQAPSPRPSPAAPFPSPPPAPLQQMQKAQVRQILESVNTPARGKSVGVHAEVAATPLKSATAGARTLMSMMGRTPPGGTTLPVAALSERRPPPPPKSLTVGGENMPPRNQEGHCARCASAMPADANFCRYCGQQRGKKVIQVKAATPPARAPPAPAPAPAARRETSREPMEAGRAKSGLIVDKPRFRYSSGLKKLKEMGYGDSEELRNILTKCSGDLSAALRMINGSSPLIRA